MGKIDTMTKKYTENPIAFTDTFNPFLCHGDREINEFLSNLREVVLYIKYSKAKVK